MNINQALNLINKNIRNLNEYYLKPENIPVKLNQNENPLDWPPDIKNDVIEFVRKRHWNRYPNFVPDELKKALAEFTSLSPDNIIAGNGSNEMLLDLLISLTESGGTVTVCQPTFTLYQILIEGLGRKAQVVYANEDLTYNVAQILEACSQNPESLLIICSPNNPTGSILTESQTRKILDEHKGFFLLDQAYVEFGGYSAIPLLKEYPNLIITKTLSKAFRGAGLRLGYMLGAPEIIKEINKIKLPYNINFFSEHVAIAALSHKKELEETLKLIQPQRQKMYDFLKTLPLDNVYPSFANFICFRTEKKDSLFSYLKENGILIRDVSSYPMLENCLRISIGSEKENELLKEKLISFFNNRK